MSKSSSILWANFNSSLLSNLQQHNVKTWKWEEEKKPTKLRTLEYKEHLKRKRKKKRARINKRGY